MIMKTQMTQTQAVFGNILSGVRLPYVLNTRDMLINTRSIEQGKLQVHVQGMKTMIQTNDRSMSVLPMYNDVVLHKLQSSDTHISSFLKYWSKGLRPESRQRGREPKAVQTMDSGGESSKLSRLC